MRQTLLLLALACAALTAQAQAVYRSEMPDGRIIYGDKPAPGAKEAKEVVLQKPNIIAPVSTKPGPSVQQKDAGAGGDRVQSARQALDAAKAALAAGREEKEGDRIGTATKGSARLTDAYFQRVKALEDAVAAAQKQLDDARR